MFTNPLGNPGVQQLKESLFPTADSNQDGRLSRDEFTDFVTRRLEDLNTTSRPSASDGRPIMHGFDATKMETATSVKYRFARVAADHDLSGVQDQTTAEALLQSMTGDLEAAGVAVRGVRGHRLNVVDDNGDAVWVDVIRGAQHGEAPAYQWLTPASLAKDVL